MDVLERYERLFGIKRTAEFERRVDQAAQQAMENMDQMVAAEDRLKQVSLLYVRGLEHLSEASKTYQVAQGS